MYKVQLKEAYFWPNDDEVLIDTTVGNLLRDIATSYPSQVAFVDIDEDGSATQQWTYRELLKDSEELAFALSTRFVKGDKVVVWAPNIPEWILMEYACGLAGLILVTANPSFQSQELTYVLEQSRAKGLFLISEFRGNPMAEIAKEATKNNKTITEITDLRDKKKLHQHGEKNPDLPEIFPEDPVQIQYTSGTTGFPKGAILSHTGLVNNARLFCNRKKVSSSSVWSNFMPLFHTAGCATGTLGCLQAACKMLLIKKFDAKIFAKLIEEQGVTTCFAVPTMLFALLEELEKNPRDVSSLEVISTGGAPVPPELVRRVRESLGCHLLTAFGQTEHSPMISLNPLESTLEQIIETAGQPLPHTEVSIRAVENNQMVPVDCVGEICARSYGIMLRYNDNEGATSAAIDPDGWLHTGDLGTIDKDGFIRVTGRIKDMIIKGGENYFPAEIEATLIMNPDIIQVSVVGLPDHKWGEIIAAFFISNSTVNIKSLRDHCRKNLSPQKTPSTWVRVLEFPLTASGKIQKFSLREKYLEGNYGEKLEF